MSQTRQTESEVGHNVAFRSVAMLDGGTCVEHRNPATSSRKSNVISFPGLPAHHEIQDLVLARDGYTLRHARILEQRKQASMLIKNMYEWRGYSADRAATLSCNSNLAILETSDKHNVFGTLSIRIDSTEGLFAEELYRKEIGILRNMGHRLCEMTKLAFDPEHSSKEIIASLFHLGYIYARSIYQCTDILIEINPRHAAFYQPRLGFQTIGEERNCPRVDAPAVLLILAMDYVDEQITRFAGSRDPKEKSLYPYFLSEAELADLAGGLQRAA